MPAKKSPLKKSSSQLGRYSRNKGASGEREVANLFRERGILASRTVGQGRSGGDAPDVTLPDLPWLWAEVKRGKMTFPKKALAQATAACGRTKTPVAITRDDRADTLVTLGFDFFVCLLKAAYPGACHGGPLPGVRDDDADEPSSPEAAPEAAARSPCFTTSGLETSLSPAGEDCSDSHDRGGEGSNVDSGDRRDDEFF